MNQQAQNTTETTLKQHDDLIWLNKKRIAADLHEKFLKPGCERLLELNRSLVQAERKQRIRGTLHRLAWVGGLSCLVILVSYLTIGVTLITAVGLLVAYFTGLIFHSKLSPKIELPKAEKQALYNLNDELRDHILASEKESDGLIGYLLEKAELTEQTEKIGFMYCEQEIGIEELNRDGLYHYLDAMNLLMEHENRAYK